MLIEPRLMQSSNALTPIFRTLSGMLTVVSAVQVANACSAMYWRPSGSVTDLRVRQLLN